MAECLIRTYLAKNFDYFGVGREINCILIEIKNITEQLERIDRVTKKGEE